MIFELDSEECCGVFQVRYMGIPNKANGIWKGWEVVNASGGFREQVVIHSCSRGK